MEVLVATALAVVTSCGVYLVLRGRTFPVIIGLSLLGYAVNFFIFVMGRLQVAAPPILKDGQTVYADPLPQALVLTAIVIGFAMTGFIVELALRARHESGSDHVDAARPPPAGTRAASESSDARSRQIEKPGVQRSAAGDGS